MNTGEAIRMDQCFMLQVPRSKCLVLDVYERLSSKSSVTRSIHYHPPIWITRAVSSMADVFFPGFKGWDEWIDAVDGSLYRYALDGWIWLDGKRGRDLESCFRVHVMVCIFAHTLPYIALNF